MASTVHPEPSPASTGALSTIGPILVALGGDDDSDVLRAATLFASTAIGGMLALSVLQPTAPYLAGDYPTLISPQLDQQRAGFRHEALKREVSDLGAATTCESRVEFGDPAFQIAGLARTRHSPLIVMGVGRRRLLDRWLGSETAARTIRRAPCPVLAVSANVELPFSEAVIAMDFSAASISAAMASVPLMATNAVMHLVHVWEPSMVDDERLRSMNDAYRASLPARFKRVEALLSVPFGVTVKHELREGKVVEHILALAEARHAGLIVAGRHGLNAIERFFVGSVTTTLLRATPCSLLVAPEPALAQRDTIMRRMTGTTESRAPLEWAVLIDSFSRRNVGRRTALEIDEAALGAQILESGFVLQGAAYDYHRQSVELMLGDGTTRHLTRTIADVDSISVYTDHHGHDAALRVTHGAGKSLLTFLAG